MKRSVNTAGVSQSKLDHIKSGTTKKTQLGGEKEKKKVIEHKGGKFHVTETEKKFEEAGVSRKKRNYVMYESKLGTTKEQNLQKIEQPKPKPKPKEKPKPTPAPKPRQEERIIQKKKKKQYLDNYQYHETKEIRDKNPNRVSIVTHQRLGDIVGGTFEETTYQKRTITDSGRGQKLYSQQSAKTSTRKDAKGNVTKTATQSSNTVSRTLPAQSREMRREIKTLGSHTNLRGAPKKAEPPQRNAKSPTTGGRGNRGNASTSRTTKTTTTTTTTRTQKTSTRTQSAGKGGRKH